jgi:hydrogenase nickel incorporation protein HypB
MCQDCGCGDTNIVSVELHEKILAKNDSTAEHNRSHVRAAGVLCVNLMGSPGAGKTAVLEETGRAASGAISIGAIAGDLATDNDARRLKAAGIRAEAVNTGSMCHLDAELVHRALHHFDLGEIDLLFIENVGNLVCPAVYDLGQHVNVVALAVTEGEDKPLKYPTMFAKADLVLLTKTDLLPHLPNVRVEAIHQAISRVMPKPRVIEFSAIDERGVSLWLDWLQSMRNEVAPVAGAVRW